jgi:hypothetical protein
MTSTPAQLVEEYIQLRDAKVKAEDLSKEFMRTNFTDRMETLEQLLLDILNANGLDSIAGPSGTAYKKISTSVTVADPREFRRHIIGAEQWDLLDWRANKTAVNDLVDKGEPLPPGVNRSAFLTVGIRRKS